MVFDWEQYIASGEYVKFEEIGDSIIGTIKDIREGQTFNGNPCPELLLTDDAGEDHIVTAGQVMLRSTLAEKSPQVGDKVRIVFSGVGEAQPGKTAPKLFQVDVKRGAAPAPVQQTWTEGAAPVEPKF